MPLRIQVSSSDSGPSNFNFGVNPSFMDAADEANIAKFPVLHGSDVHQSKAFDSRPRIMRWEGFPTSNTDMNGIVDYFRSIEGQIRYFNFQDLDEINQRWPSLVVWNKARIITIKIKYRKGGKLKYDSVELVIEPSE